MDHKTLRVGQRIYLKILSLQCIVQSLIHLDQQNFLIKNESLGYELLESNPFETNAMLIQTLLLNYLKIITLSLKYHRDHGFEDSGKSYVFLQIC